MNISTRAKQLFQSCSLNNSRTEVTTAQLNLGAMCNQRCAHCHVNAGPERIECMDETVIDRVFDLLRRSPSVRVLDLTGGAPELHPLFRNIVERASSIGLEIIDRNNLTVLFEGGQEGLPEFLAENKAHIIASLPCYTEENVDRQRGGSVFNKSVRALKILNELGYGHQGSSLVLDLVFNPSGAELPGDQESLNCDYHAHLWGEYGISFNRLLTMANVPIARFRSDLELNGDYESYLDLLADNFNAQTLRSIMCKKLVSIGWDGMIYDCDFNQALRLPPPSNRTVFGIESFGDLSGDSIRFDEHCLACMAGAGNSCFGAALRSSGANLQEAAV